MLRHFTRSFSCSTVENWLTSVSLEFCVKGNNPLLDACCIITAHWIALLITVCSWILPCQPSVAHTTKHRYGPGTARERAVTETPRP